MTPTDVLIIGIRGMERKNYSNKFKKEWIREKITQSLVNAEERVVSSNLRNEKMFIKVYNLQPNLRVALLQLGDRIIDAFYISKNQRGEVNLEGIVDKIVESINKRTLGIMIDDNYVCRIPPFRKSDVTRALRRALRDGVGKFKVMKCFVKNVEKELIKAFEIRGFRFRWKKWIGNTQFDFLVMILHDRQVLFDVIEDLNYESSRKMQGKLRLIQRIAEKYDLDLVYYCVRKEDICKSVPQFLNLLERILLGNEVRPSGLLMMRSPKVDNSGNGIRVLFKRRIASDKSGRQEYYIDILTAKKSDVKLVRSIRLSDKLSMNVQRICDAMYNDLGVHYDFKFDAYVNLLNNIMNKGFMIMIMKPMLRRISNQVNEKSIESVDVSRRDENQEDKNNQRCEVK